MTRTRKSVPPQEQLSKVENGGRRTRILVVDDDTDFTEVLCLFLNSSGYDAVRAADGLAALEQLKDGILPDLILLDLMMPRLDGWEFRKAQLSDSRLKDLPVVVLSAGGELIKPIQANHLLRKPFDPDRLLEAIERYRLG